MESLIFEGTVAKVCDTVRNWPATSRVRAVCIEPEPVTLVPLVPVHEASGIWTLPASSDRPRVTTAMVKELEAGI